MAKTKTQSAQPPQPKLIYKLMGLGFGIIFGLIIIYFIFHAAYLDTGNSNDGQQNDGLSNVQELGTAVIGVPYALNFTKALSHLLDPNGTVGPSSYSFYIGSGGAESPPKGLALGADGVLRGTPTGEGSTFEVCIQDADERSACWTYNLNTNYAGEESNNNGNVQGASNTAKPTSVTIDSGSCIITNNGYIDIPSTMCQIGARYAKYYGLTLSGSMTGPVGTVFSVNTDPATPQLVGEVFSCGGGWEKDNVLYRCTRKVSSNAETAQWSLTRDKIFGEYVNLNPRMQVIINAEVRNESRIWETLLNATYTVSCPTIDYCSMVKTY